MTEGIMFIRCKENLWELVLSFYCVCSRDQVQDIRLGDKRLYFLNCFTGPALFCFETRPHLCISGWPEAHHGVHFKLTVLISLLSSRKEHEFYKRSILGSRIASGPHKLCDLASLNF